MVKKIKSELLPLSRELAQTFTQMRPVAGERPLRKSRLKYFENRLRQHRLNSPNWAKAIIDGLDGEWRADGQHTSHVLAACDDSLFPADLPVTISTYRLDGPDDLPDLFDLFDNPISARSNTDKIGVYVADFPELAAIDRGFLSKVARGIDYYSQDAPKGPQGHFVSREHGLYFFDEANRAFAVWLYRKRETEHAWMFAKPGITAEIYNDWKTQPDLAEHFWGEVLTESNPDPDDDTRELSRTFRDWSRRQPKIRQDKFRNHAKKLFDRYRRMANSRSKDSTEMGNVPPMLPQASTGLDAISLG